MHAHDWLSIYDADKQRISGQNTAPSVEHFRNVSYERLKEEGIPDRKMEIWRHTPLHLLAHQNFHLRSHKEDTLHKINADHTHTLPTGSSLVNDPDSLELRLTNGYFEESQATRINAEYKGMEISRFSKMGKELPEEIVRQFLHLKSGKEYNFSLLNNLLHEDFPVIRIKKGAKIDKRLNVVHMCESLGDTALFPKCWIYLEEDSQIELMEVFHSESDERFWFNASTAMYISNRATLSYIRLQSQNEKSFNYHLGQAYIQKDARLNALSVSIGAYLDRHDFFVHLQGSGAHADLKGLYICNGSETADHHTVIRHEVPNTHSDQYYKGILHEKGHGIFCGRIDILKNAYGCTSRQLNKNLLLSDHASVDTRPELNIQNHDVKCSHGATIGQLNPDEKFYLESRGIPEHLATVMLAHGFLDDVFNRFQDSQIKHLIEPFLAKFYKSLDCLELN